LGLGSAAISNIITKHNTLFLIISFVMLGLAGYFTFKPRAKCSRSNKLTFCSASVLSLFLIVYALFFK
jgi:hypothetical protein